MSNWLILRETYIPWVCAPGYGGPWPWGLGILSKVNPTKWALGFPKKVTKFPSWIWPSDDFENRFGLSDGHIGGPVYQTWIARERKAHYV